MHAFLLTDTHCLSVTWIALYRISLFYISVKKAACFFLGEGGLENGSNRCGRG
jgi:hypothetical protein